MWRLIAGLSWLGWLASTAVAQPDPTNSVILKWTASGDDSLAGRAASYDLRYTTGLFSARTWGLAMPGQGEPPPSLAGQPDTILVTGLQPGTTYRFGLKVRDEVMNTSDLSNIVTITTASTLEADHGRVSMVVSVEPNPFRNYCRLTFQTVNLGPVDLIIYDLFGRPVAHPVIDHPSIGLHAARWNPSATIRPGVYWYSLRRGQRVDRGKLVYLLK